ncbi:MAG: L-2-amino-thiazoline-4-carboxylic acid hydrolase [Desulfobacterales bacterium]|nr:MAG: L-2-amino-thiazoline-4-carboxylic acid hydrolase [Desulfobacterales bacterium]
MNNYNEKSEKHKFQNDFSQTYEDAFRWKFVYHINIMKRFSDCLGRDKLLELIMRAVEENNKRNATANPEHTLSNFAEYGKEAYKNMMTYEVIEESDEVYEMKVTECLWAKTFRDKNAADIGYATICHGDFTEATAYHQKLKLKRTKTLMQGHDCCNHRWTWEG